MIKRARKHLSVAVLVCLSATAFAQDEWDTLPELPPIANNTILYDNEVRFGYRGKAGRYALFPSLAGIYFDDHQDAVTNLDWSALDAPTPKSPMVFIQPLKEGVGDDEMTQGNLIENGAESFRHGDPMCIVYDLTSRRTFCGAYLILLADLRHYACLRFMIRGETGGESFELGMNDTFSNKREDAVVIGSIYRYLPNGVTTNWQEVIIPMDDFFGPDLSRIFSLVFMFSEVGQGRFWINDFRFYKIQLVDREAEIRRKGYLLMDNFDHSDVNLLGRKCGVYNKFPSSCKSARVESIRVGNHGRALQLRYNKKASGWCGYYTLLNQVDGEYYDLREYESVSFMIRSDKGGETFEMGLADRSWINIGDSLKAGALTKYLPDGITTNWQKVTVPLEDFGLLDFSDMGSFSINFHEKGTGTIYIDDLRFNLRNQELVGTM